MNFVSASGENGEIRYRDTKRYLWILSVLSPCVPGFAALAVASGADPAWAWAPIIFYFVAIPVLDLVFGEDRDNPPEAVVEALSQDNYYRILLFAAVASLHFSAFAAFIVIATTDLPVWANLGLAISAGISSGAGLTVAHELGHKTRHADRLAAKLVLALSGYAHFCIEHNRGHHSQVATPDDPASARLGETVYGFALRELPGAARRGWALERARLEAKGLPFLHWRNDLLHGYALCLTYAALLIWLGGLWLLPLLALHHGVAWLQLTFANYVEHYGLLRQKQPSGRHEPCAPHHSWNTNHIVSNLMLFHLQRHSDHHANPMRPYQTLRNFPDLPRLPSGYPGSFALASFPPLWFRVMDPKVMAWADGDLSRTNHVAGYGSTQERL